MLNSTEKDSKLLDINHMLNNYQITTYSTIDEKAPSVYIMTLRKYIHVHVLLDQLSIFSHIKEVDCVKVIHLDMQTKPYPNLNVSLNLYEYKR